MLYNLNHVSFSSLNMFIRNPENWYFRYVLGLKMPPAKAFMRGRGVHTSIEYNYTEKLRQQPATDEAVIGIYEQEIVKLTGEYERDMEATKDFLTKDYLENESEETFEQIKDGGIKGIKLYRKELEPDIMPLEVETKFELATSSVDLTGRIDLIDTDKNIRDTKTSKKSPPEDDADDDPQLKTYDLAYRTRYKEKPKALIKDYIVFGKKDAKIVSLKAEATTEYRMREHLRNLQSAIKIMQFCIANDAWHNLTTEKWAKSPKWNGYWQVSRDLHLHGLDYVKKKYCKKLMFDYDKNMPPFVASSQGV